jgi:hypothetical protein
VVFLIHFDSLGVILVPFEHWVVILQTIGNLRVFLYFFLIILYYMFYFSINRHFYRNIWSSFLCSFLWSFLF